MKNVARTCRASSAEKKLRRPVRIRPVVERQRDDAFGGVDARQVVAEQLKRGREDDLPQPDGGDAAEREGDRHAPHRAFPPLEHPPHPRVRQKSVTVTFEPSSTVL